MAIEREEIKKKALAAASAEEVMEIVRASGEEITPEEAARFFEEAQKLKADRSLFLDELEAVSGGADRDWITDGCAATVENRSWCGSNDKCIWFQVTYDNPPTRFNCPKCGISLYASGNTNTLFATKYRKFYTCKLCGYVYVEYVNLEEH